MKRRGLYLLGAVILSVVLVASLSVGGLKDASAEKVFRWKIQSAYPRGDLSMELLADFARVAKEKSNGQLEIQVFADPELVPGEQLFEATKKGTLDMLHAVPAMWGGLIPVGEVEFGLPYAWKSPPELAGIEHFPEAAADLRKFFYDSGFADLLRKEYAKHGLYWLDLHSYGPIFTMATSPIHTCEDLKGKKMRMEGSWMTYYDMLGARGTALPGTEAYMALKLGTLNGSQWDVSCIVGLKWHEVAPYWLRGTDPENVIGNILVNMDSWKALPPDCKTALQEAAEYYWDALIDIYVGELNKVAELVKEGKVIESWIDEACQKKHEEAAVKLWDEIGKRDPAAAKAIEMIKAWRGL